MCFSLSVSSYECAFMVCRDIVSAFSSSLKVEWQKWQAARSGLCEWTEASRICNASGMWLERLRFTSEGYWCSLSFLTGCEALTLDADMKSLNFCGTKFVCWIMVYHCDFPSNQRLLCEVGVRSITFLFKECWFWHYEHMAKFLDDGSTYKVLT